MDHLGISAFVAHTCEEIACMFWNSHVHYHPGDVMEVQRLPEPPGDFGVTRIHPEYEGEKCPYCFRKYPFPVKEHHTTEECEFWERRMMQP